MQSMSGKKAAEEAACAAAVKARRWGAAAEAAERVADCAEILAGRTCGAVSAAYAKETESWRALAKRLEAKKEHPGAARSGRAAGAPSGRAEAEDGGAGGEEWLVGERPDVTFDDIAGMEEAKRVIDEMVLYPMKSPEKARALGLEPGGGVLLFGPPGTGKTMLGKAIAGALDAPFYYASGADLRSKWYGESEQRLSRLLNAAKSHPVAVVFLDEIESLLPKRGGAHAADNRVVTQFLSDLGGFKGNPNLLLVLGATNKPWDIDEAVFRTGRFDEKVYIGPPDLPTRRKILEMNLKGAATAPDVDLDAVAAAMEGASGSDMAAVVSAAKRGALGRAIREDAEPVLTGEDFDTARKRIPLSITEAILTPYRRFMEERF